MSIPIALYLGKLLWGFSAYDVSDATLYIANIIIIFIYLWSIFTWMKTTKNPCSLYLLFLMYAFFCNAGQTFLRFFPDPGYDYIYIYQEYTNTYIVNMLAFQGLCIIFMQIGALFSISLFSNSEVRVTTPFEKFAIPKSKLLDWAFYGASFFAIVDCFRTLSLRMQYSYGDFYFLSKNSFSIFTTSAFFLTMISYVLRNADNYQKRNIVNFIVLLQIVTLLLAGRRTMVIPLIATSLFLIVVRRPKVLANKRKIFNYIIIGILLMAVMGTISELRTYSLSDLFSGSIPIASSVGLFKNLGQAIHEMGMSSQTIIMTMQYIDAGVTHQQTILYNLAESFIPHFILNTIGIHAPSVESLSTWVTYYGMSSTSSAVSGYGYSFIAEAYFDFGKLGFIFTGFYGFIVTFLEIFAIKKIRTGYALAPSIIIYLLSHQIFFARAQFDLATGRIRLMFYLLIIYYIGQLIYNSSYFRKNKKSAFIHDNNSLLKLER